MKKQIIKWIVLWASFFIWLSSGYLFLFAALDWSNLTNNVWTWSTLTADIWNNSLTNLKNNSDANELSIAANNANIWKQGSVVTVWWTQTAPAWSTLLYQWIGFWGHYTHNWGSRLCLEEWSAWWTTATVWDIIYPLSTWAATYMPPWITGDRQVTCSVVYTTSAIFEAFWSQTCPTNWTVLYKWYAMNSYYTHANWNATPICVDSFNFDASRSYAWTNGSYLAGTKVWSSSDVPNYPSGNFVKCAICSKD